MKRSLLIGIANLLLMSLSLNAQDSLLLKKENYKNIYSIDILKPFFRQVRLGYEKQVAPNLYLNARVGALFANADTYENEEFIVFFPVYTKVFNGVFASFGYSRNFKGELGYYNGVEISYFLKYFNEKLYFCGTGQSFTSHVDLNSIYRHKFGFLYSFGYRFRVFKGNSFTHLIDMSLGLGAQYRIEIIKTFTTSDYYQSFTYVNDPPQITKSFIPLPLAEFSLKYAFYRNKQ